jgi:hypothetical protein
VLKKARCFFSSVPDHFSAIQLQQHMPTLSLVTLRLSRKNHRISRKLLECKKMKEFCEAKPHSSQSTLATNKKMR